MAEGYRDFVAGTVGGFSGKLILASSGGDWWMTTTTAAAAAATWFLRTASVHTDLEFIVQRNDETEPLWSALLPRLERRSTPPDNVVFLHDESKGTGKSIPGGVWPTDTRFTSSNMRNIVGFAGGIWRIAGVRGVGGDRFWFDMESGVHTTTVSKKDDDGTRREVDIIDGLCEAGWMDHPPGL
ncbi:hypothetical protein ACHAW5_010432 [Stephanodiscus triporus]|uniref:Phospholipase B-like n=1 Tax=Stephanodiscus triporus TaxID=2934178 RepID=A0ABD3NZI4_9STRA